MPAVPAAGASARPPVPLTRYAWLSVAAALVTMALKAAAAWLTGSVGLLSDAAESSVNLVAALAAVVALRIAARPADRDHAYGFTKAEYVAAGFEGALILVAAAAIVIAAIDRLLHPQGLQDVGIGLAVTMVAASVNLVVAVVELRAGRRHRSITLEADARHLLTDVWTSVGVLVGVGAAGLTGWEPLDPIVGLAVGVNIVAAGVVLLRRSTRGLLDAGLDPDERGALEAVLEQFQGADVQFHAVRSRQAGRRSFVSLHVLVPGRWTVQRSHDLVEQLEEALRGAVPGLTVEAHVEPLEDPASFADLGLDRPALPPSARPGGAAPQGRSPSP